MVLTNPKSSMSPSGKTAGIAAHWDLVGTKRTLIAAVCEGFFGQAIGRP